MVRGTNTISISLIRDDMNLVYWIRGNAAVLGPRVTEGAAGRGEHVDAPNQVDSCGNILALEAGDTTATPSTSFVSSSVVLRKATSQYTKTVGIVLFREDMNPVARIKGNAVVLGPRVAEGAAGRGEHVDAPAQADSNGNILATEVGDTIGTPSTSFV
ncbi:hypothetical protein HAX54_009797 [Datura stramonium]|uniref:Uncharacterized protein n=1 Tax=Datura stramonium TaxID=4076 RepID=A0ABS8TGQ9_DATST|nr:hypothetical protein [Datura stramonium]